ncbi:MAG: hypothetical protein OIF55_16925 [Amphritea sp.]|nr:hypothetical protein [Amphritea sp.]
MNIDDLEPWPLAKLDYPLNNGYRYQRHDNRQHSQMEAGAGVSRLKSRYTVVEYQFELLLTAAQEAYFRWWIAAKINMGNDWFAMPLLTGAAVNTVAAQFSKKGIGASVKSGRFFRVKCKAVSFELPSEQLEEPVLDDLLHLGTMEFTAGVDTLRKAVNED